MRAPVLYESMFGNAGKIAQTVAEGLGTRLDVELTEVGAVLERVPADVDLLVVVSPTHGFRMPNAESRESPRRP